MDVERRFKGLFFLFIAIILGSCTPVKFSSEPSQSDPTVNPQGPPGGGGGNGAIDCSPLLDGNYASVNLTSASSNPSLAANCTPSNVTYNWSVVRGVTPVTINGLTGDTSVPDFLSAGNGDYYISLNATAVGWTSYNSTTPLHVNVNIGGGGPAITCSPKLNGTQTSVTTTSTATNPIVTGNCTPTGVSYTWTVTRAGNPVTIANLAGSSSTGDFFASGSGTYLIYLTAQAVGYTSYTSSTPLTVTVPGGGGGGTTVNQTYNVPAGNNKLDILLVVDDSSSMLADNQRLASRLQPFVSDLTTAGFDWQMCVTLTRAQRISSADPNYYWGASWNWSGNPNSPAWILKAGTANTSTIFTNTINAIGAGWLGTDDERAIKATWWHLWNGEPGVAGTSGCYRPDAGLAVIILSDEDERSIGGDQSQVYYDAERNKNLETDDLPSTYVNYVKQVFGTSKRFTVNSIIVRPGDTACMTQQDAEGSKSHYGVKYNELSNLTSGYAGSICAADYATNLQYFRDSIVTAQASVTLNCNATSVTSETVTPNYVHTTALSGNRLIFNPQLPAGSTVQLQYVCP